MQNDIRRAKCMILSIKDSVFQNLKFYILGVDES